MEESRLQQRWERPAPARVNLLGEHTDYTWGSVLPMAVRSNALLITHIRTLRTICSGENMSRIGEAELGKTLDNDGPESGIPPNRSAHVRASVAMRISPHPSENTRAQPPEWPGNDTISRTSELQDLK